MKNIVNQIVYYVSTLALTVLAATFVFWMLAPVLLTAGFGGDVLKILCDSRLVGFSIGNTFYTFGLDADFFMHNGPFLTIASLLTTATVSWLNLPNDDAS